MKNRNAGQGWFYQQIAHWSKLKSNIEELFKGCEVSKRTSSTEAALPQLSETKKKKIKIKIKSKQ